MIDAAGKPHVRIPAAESVVVHQLFEQQRWMSPRLDPAVMSQAWMADRKLPWVDGTGLVQPREGLELPSSSWVWANDWQIQPPGRNGDPDGWEFAVDLAGPFLARLHATHLARRRCWARTRHLRPGCSWSCVPLPGHAVAQQVP